MTEQSAPINTGLSIILIAYNEEHLLSVLLDCLLAQTWQSFELIFVDSASTDGTLEIARSYGDRFQEFQLIELAEARGPGYARNQGALRARYDHLLFLDADSTLAPDFLGRAWQAISRSAADVATCFIHMKEASLLSRSGGVFLNLCMLLLKPVYTTAYGACLFSTQAVHGSLNGFREDLAICEDCNYVKRARKLAGVRFRILWLSFGTSDRRALRDGSFRFMGRYIGYHLYRMFTGKEIETGKIDYEYGNNSN